MNRRERHAGQSLSIVMVGTAMALVVGVVCPALGQQLTATAGGATIKVSSGGLDTLGYWPVLVQLVPKTPEPQDRKFHVEFRSGRNMKEPSLLTRQDVVLPAGAASHEVIISLPVVDFGVGTVAAVWEHDPRKPLLEGVIFSTPFAGFEYEVPHLLIVGRTLPDTSAIVSAFPTVKDRLQAASKSFLSRAILPEAEAMPLADLPENWLHYTRRDVVCLSLDELKVTATQHAGKLTVLRAWVLCGGTLWVYGVGEKAERIGELDDALNVPRESSSGADSPWSPGSQFTQDDVERAIPSRDVDRHYHPYYQEDTLSKTVRTAVAKLASIKPVTTDHFLTRPLGLGLLVAIKPSRPFPGTRSQWVGVLTAMGHARWSWLARHWLDRRSELLNFLPQGVGTPPATAFRVLISLFVAVVGPLNLILLWRWRRLHLALFTVPTLAALATAGLLVYALASDGIAPRLRVQSMTWIDQRAKQASCWTLASYYASFAPSGGLTFSSDVAVFPLGVDSVDYRYRYHGHRYYRNSYVEPGRLREIVLGSQQRLTAGWIDSRTPMQFLMLRSRASNAALRVSQPEAKSNRRRVFNELGCSIKYLRFRASDGLYYDVQNLANQAGVVVEPGPPGQVWSNLPSVLFFPQDQLCPILPNKAAADGGSESADSPEVQIKGANAVFDAARGQASEMPLRRNTFVAIVDGSPEVEAGLVGAREEGSFHVIMGQW